jgi:putative phosphoribosyl transferase
MTAAARAIRARNPAKIVVAVPVASADTCQALQREVDEVVCPATPEPFYAVGLWYDDFGQTSDDDVRRILMRAHPNTEKTRG